MPETSPCQKAEAGLLYIARIINTCISNIFSPPNGGEKACNISSFLGNVTGIGACPDAGRHARTNIPAYVSNNICIMKISAQIFIFWVPTLRASALAAFPAPALLVQALRAFALAAFPAQVLLALACEVFHAVQGIAALGTARTGREI